MITYKELNVKTKEIERKTGLQHLDVYRRFMFERILERISVSKYKDNFILKGGLLLSAMFGIESRNTRDIDISTGDEITPRELKYEYFSLFEDKSIYIDSYNIETILSEKIETVLRRTLYNGRMKDFYDIYIFLTKFKHDINMNDFKKAFEKTLTK